MGLVWNSVRVVSFANSGNQYEQIVSVGIFLLHKLTVFVIGNDCIVGSIYHNNGYLMLFECINSVEGVRLKAEQICSCNTGICNHKFTSPDTLGMIVFELSGITAEVKHGCINKHTNNTLGVISRKIYRVRSATAHSHRHAFVAQSVLFREKLHKSRLSVTVLFSGETSYIILPSDVKALI